MLMDCPLHPRSTLKGSGRGRGALAPTNWGRASPKRGSFGASFYIQGLHPSRVRSAPNPRPNESRNRGVPGPVPQRTVSSDSFSASFWNTWRKALSLGMLRTLWNTWRARRASKGWCLKIERKPEVDETVPTVFVSAGKSGSL